MCVPTRFYPDNHRDPHHHRWLKTESKVPVRIPRRFKGILLSDTGYHDIVVVASSANM